MQIRTLFMLCMTTFTGLATGLGGWILTQAVEDYRLADRLETAVAVNSLLFEVADMIAAEEPIVHEGLLRDQPRDGVIRMALDAIRQGADRAIDQAERRIGALSYPGVHRQLDILHTIQEDVPALRDKADTMLARPRRDREPAAFGRYLNATNAMSDALDFALDLGDLAAARSDGVTVDLMLISRLASSVRRLDGLRSAPLIVAVDAGAMLAPAQLEQQAQLNGSSRAAWKLVGSLSRRLASLPGMTTTIEAAYGVFIDHDRMCQAVVTAGRGDGRYPLSTVALSESTSKSAIALKGLRNRTMLHERMEQALTLVGRGQKCAALCLDLDRFKAVNDTFGHPMGDRLLQAVAERLLACVRETDTVCRLEGDEFVVLLVGLEQPDDAGLLARRIVQTLSEPFDLDGQIMVVGASVGIAIAPQDATSGVVLVKSADTALYRAKSEERGTFCYFEADMDARLQARMTLERDLREAVRTDGFEVFYQPQYELAADTLSGFEALVRWRHSRRGLVPPSEFIPLAEETGLIVPIGTWVLRRACQEAMHWPDRVRLAVNLSAVQFKNSSLVQNVREALVASGLPATRLELEITESVLLNNNTDILAMLHQLRDMGVSISMDDFGTGYSSLSYLRSFPFNKIKIDQLFIRDVSRHEDSKAIVRAVVALGASLGMKTTAEGVETADQLAQLRLEGCTEVQGFLFSKPTPAAEAKAAGQRKGCGGGLIGAGKTARRGHYVA